MPWNAVRVRPATSEDVPALLAFGAELRDRLLPPPDSKRSRAAAAARSSLDVRYLEALADPDRHLVVAVGDDDVPVAVRVPNRTWPRFSTVSRCSERSTCTSTKVVSRRSPVSRIHPSRRGQT